MASLGEDRQVAVDLSPVEGMDQAPVSPQGLGYPPPDLLVVVDPVVARALDVEHHQALLIPHLELHLGLVAVQEDPGHMVEMMDFVKINSGEAAADALVDQVVKNFDREKLISSGVLMKIPEIAVKHLKFQDQKEKERNSTFVPKERGSYLDDPTYDWTDYID